MAKCPRCKTLIISLIARINEIALDTTADIRDATENVAILW
jgi:hypothetical protein